MYHRILVPTDGSELAAAAARAAIALARVCGAEIVALAVAYPEPVLLSAEGALATGGAGIDVLLEQARCHVAQVADAARLAGVPCTALAVYGDSPADEIATLAQRRHCDLIFMATHGRRGLSGLIAGSVTRQVLARSQAAVMVYRPAGDAGRERDVPGLASATGAPV